MHETRKLLDIKGCQQPAEIGILSLMPCTVTGNIVTYALHSYWQYSQKPRLQWQCFLRVWTRHVHNTTRTHLQTRGEAWKMCLEVSGKNLTHCTDRLPV